MTREEEIKKLDAMAKPRSEEAVKKAEERKKQREVIDRACEWLENYLKPLPHELDEFINERNLIIERFRKAMEQ